MISIVFLILAAVTWVNNGTPAAAIVPLVIAGGYILFKLIPMKTTKGLSVGLAILAVYVAGAAWLFHGEHPAIIKYISAPGHAKVLLWTAIVFNVLAAIISLVLKYWKSPAAKRFRHGPEFAGANAKEQAGIVIGGYNKSVLPELARTFSTDEKYKLVLPYNRLSRGITILADQGAGKTRLMKAIHDGIIEKYPDIPILIHDPKGEWLRALYNPDTDLIFAPHDARTCGWRLWEDFKNHPELRHSLITSCVEAHHSGHSDRFWSDSATQLLKSAVAQPNVEAALAFLKMKRKENSDDKTFQSVYATAALSFRDIAGIELTAKETQTTKTIDELLAHKGRIFLLNSPSCSAEQHGPLTLMLSAFLLQAISLHDLGEDELRAAVILDEALTFHLPAEVERVVYSQSRSKGLCVIASAQRLPDKEYGERGIWSNQANHIFAMRVSDLKTREAFSRRIGNLVYEEEQTSETSHGWDTSTTKNTTERQHSAMSPESFGALKNREFILFHENGIAPGVVVDTAADQRGDIKPMIYTPRDGVSVQLGEL